MYTRSITALVACPMLFAATGVAQTCPPASALSAEVRYPVGPSPQRMAAGDLNNDGAIDLVATLSNSRAFVVLLNDGNGAFLPPVQIGTPANTSFGITTADLNNDGDADVVVGGGSAAFLTVMLGDGTGGFGVPTEFGPGIFGAPTSIQPGDFDGDGNIDLAINTTFSNVRIARGLGDGTLAMPDFLFVPGTTGTTELAVAFMDGDTDLDVVVGDSNGPVVLSGGTGTSFVTSPVVPYAPFLRAIDVADFDGDGAQDAIVTGVIPDDVSVFLNDGAGTLSFAFGGPLVSVPSAIATADFDQDGWQDAVVTLENTAATALLVGDGAGGLSLAATLAGGSQPLDSVAADFDGNGLPDVATLNRSSGDVSVYLNACPASCNAADLAAPFGLLDQDDVNAFINAFLSAGTAADLVPPIGVVDQDDVDAFIIAFLAGCP